MNVEQLASQILSTVNLYAEILICVALASLLGCIVGLMMQRSRHNRLLQDNNSKWEERYQALEDSARDDAENLEERLQSLANETKSLQAKNRALTDMLKKNDASIQKARAESIELNRQHAESHERLQRIIQQKDREIVEVGNRLSITTNNQRTAVTMPPSASAKSPADSAELVDTDLNNADTVAISPTQISAEVLDATVQMSINSKPVISAKKSTEQLKPDPDASLDDTSDLSDMGLEESTIVMDEEALAFAQRSYKGRRHD